jgi:NADH-quinone oxidoreductase subunit M
MLHLSILLWLPLAIALVGLVVPRALVRWVALGGSLLTLALAIGFLVDFESATPGLQHATDETWIGALGVHYALGLDGLNAWLLLLAAVGFTFTFAWSALGGGGVAEVDRPGTYYFHLGVAYTGVIGALVAQDLLLFVAFFDLMLIPFFFLAVGWGTDPPGSDKVRAVTRMVVYTLVGSLLMLVGAVAIGVLATPDGQSISFSFADLAQRGVPEGSQGWIFACFAAAFLVKMPAFPIHGWLREGYKTLPLPVLAVFSGVLSKVAVYGFLRVALPLLPSGAADLRWVVLIIAVLSILYASSIALTTVDARLVLGYSSIAQLGFITLGVFSFRTDGASGAILQSVNHGLVVLPAFLAVGILASRAGGSEDIRDMGGVAFRAPIFAILFVVVTYAVLAMPGTSNFVGEFLILRGVWEGASIALACVAAIGVALAAVYALRLFIRTTHNRVGPKVVSRDLSPSELLLLGVPVLLIVALAVHPQQTLRASDRASTQSVLGAAAAADPEKARSMLEESSVGREAAATGAAGAQGAAGAAGQAVDPTTGQPADPSGAVPVDPSTGQAIDPTTGQPVDPSGGQAVPVDPSTGQPVDPSGGVPVDPSTGQPVDPTTGGAGR